MAKKDFDIDFDFDEAYGFDAKSFLGDEAYDDTVDPNAFSDEELGLSSRKESDGDAGRDDGDFVLEGGSRQTIFSAGILDTDRKSVV